MEITVLSEVSCFLMGEFLPVLFKESSNLFDAVASIADLSLLILWSGGLFAKETEGSSFSIFDNLLLQSKFNLLFMASGRLQEEDG